MRTFVHENWWAEGSASPTHKFCPEACCSHTVTNSSQSCHPGISKSLIPWSVCTFLEFPANECLWILNGREGRGCERDLEKEGFLFRLSQIYGEAEIGLGRLIYFRECEEVS